MFKRKEPESENINASFFSCSQPRKAFFNSSHCTHVVSKEKRRETQLCLAHFSKCVISCLSSRIRSLLFLCCQKEKCCLLLQTYSGWAAFCGSSVSDVCASLPKMITGLTENLLRPCELALVIHLVIRRSLFSGIGRTRDVPSGSFQSSASSSVASAVNKRFSNLLCTIF